MEEILLVNGLPKETVAGIIMLYKDTELKVRSLVADIYFFDIVAGVLPGDTLALYLFIICLNFVFQTLIDLMKENGFTLKKKKQEADDTPHQLLQTHTTQITERFWQIHQPKQNPCCTVWNRKLVAVAFM